METVFERECLCQYLYALARENGHSMDDLSHRTGKSTTELQAIFDGKISPSLDDFILIGNAAGMKITINQSFPFGHQRLINVMKLLK